MESAVKQRLIAFINFLGISKNAFEKMCGLSTRYVSNISSSISPLKLKMISLRFPELNTAWLLTGEGQMIKSNNTINGDITITGNNNSHIGHQFVSNDEIETIEIECPKCGETIDVPDNAVIPLIPVEVAKAPDLNLESFVGIILLYLGFIIGKSIKEN